MCAKRMTTRSEKLVQGLVAACVLFGCGALLAADLPQIPIDLSRYSSASAVEIRAEANRLRVSWPMGEGEFGRLTLNLTTNGPLIESFGIAASALGREDSL